MIPPSACQPWPSDRSGHAGERGDHTAAVTPRGGTRPWGLLWVPLYGGKNAFGGEMPNGIESRLLWHNAVAFFSQGNYALAAALAHRIVLMDGPHTSEALDLLHHVRASGSGEPPRLVDPWKKRPFDILLNLGLLLAVP